MLVLLLALLGTASAQDPCFDPGEALDLTLPFDGRLDSPRASLQWNSSDPPAAPQAFLDALESAWTAYESEGFADPPGTDEHRLLIAALTIPGGGIGGFTDLAPCGDGVMPVLAVQTARLDGSGPMRSLAAHELFHAVQAAYLDDFADVSEPWILEASATYAAWGATGEDEEALDDAEAWASEPWSPWDVGGRHSYGLWVLLGHLGEGAEGWHPALWEGLGASTEPVREQLAAVVPDFDAAWTRFLQDLPALTLGELDVPRPEDHGGLQGDGGVGDSFVLAHEGDGAATARIDLAGVDAVKVSGEGRLYLAAARDGVIEERSTAPALGLDVGDFDTLYVTAAGGGSPRVVVEEASPAGETWWTPESACACADGGAAVLFPCLLLVRRRR